LKALCQKAAYSALRRQVPSLEAPIPDDLQVSQADFDAALKQVSCDHGLVSSPLSPQRSSTGVWRTSWTPDHSG
ncbi:MAG: hypothetical protein F6K42_11870, partial [Leptolyngbya sp. SIO1D8]|nr:hypothetical protein [Leptolyngbya sp. SIO1D8]